MLYYLVVFIKFRSLFLLEGRFNELLIRNRVCINLVLLRFILWFSDFKLLLFVNFWCFMKLRRLFILFNWMRFRMFIVDFIWFMVSGGLGRKFVNSFFMLLYWFVIVIWVFCILLEFLELRVVSCVVVVFVIFLVWDFRWYFRVKGRRIFLKINLNFLLFL